MLKEYLLPILYSLPISETTANTVYGYLVTVILALLPISEARGAIIYGLGTGLNPTLVFIIAVGINILPIPLIFWLLDRAHFSKLAYRLFGKKMYRLIEKNKKRLEIYQELALLLFVAIPAPFTGSYTAVFIASILKMNKKKSFLVISIGVLIAALIVFAGTTGSINLLNAP